MNQTFQYKSDKKCPSCLSRAQRCQDAHQNTKALHLHRVASRQDRACFAESSVGTSSRVRAVFDCCVRGGGRVVIG